MRLLLSLLQDSIWIFSVSTLVCPRCVYLNPLLFQSFLHDTSHMLIAFSTAAGSICFLADLLNRLCAAFNCFFKLSARDIAAIANNLIWIHCYSPF